MAAVVIKDTAKAAWVLPGIAGVRAKTRGMVQQAAGYAAATVMICAVGAALLQLVVQIAGLPAPVAVTAFTMFAMALFRSLRRHRALIARCARAGRAIRHARLCVCRDGGGTAWRGSVTGPAGEDRGHHGHDRVAGSGRFCCARGGGAWLG